MSKPRPWLSYLGLILLPLLLLIGLLAPGLAWNENLKQIEAAVVNADEAVVINGQTIPLGRQLTAALMDSNREQNFKWVIATEEAAREGVLSGKYAAVVRIPKDFSAIATRLDNPNSASQAVIKVETSKVLGIVDTAIGQAVAAAAVRALNTTLTSNYLDRIYIGFNTLGAKVNEIESATQALSEGSAKLAGGLGQLSDHSARLNSGAEQLSNGIAQFSGGLEKLSNSSSQLRQNGESVQGGVKQLSEGVQRLDQGFADLRKIMQELEPLLKDLPDLKPILTDLFTQLDTWEPVVKDLVVQLEALASENKDLDQKFQDLFAKLDNLTKQIPCPQDFNVQQCQAFKAGVAATDKALQPYRKAIEDFRKRLDAKLNKFSEKLVKTKALTEKLQPLRRLLQEKLKNVDTLLPDELLTKIHSLLQGITQLANGAQTTSAGTEKYISGVKQYTESIDRMAVGVQQASSGVGAFNSGLRQYTEGVDRAKAGSDQLADGANKLAEGVAQGTKYIPSYDEQQRQNLAKVVANPVAGDSLNGVVIPDIPWVTLVVILTLWLSALASYLVIPAVRKKAALSTKPTVLIHLDALLPGWLTVFSAAVFAGVAVALLLPLSVLEIVAVFGILLLTAVSFVAVNHALVAWLGRAGQFIAVALAVLGFGAGISQNPWFSGLAGLAPTAPALTGLRAIIVGAPQLSVSLLSLVIWLILALAVGLTAITQARTIEVKDLR